MRHTGVVGVVLCPVLVGRRAEIQEELDRAFATHGITNVGPPMEQAEAERLLDQLAGVAVPS